MRSAARRHLLILEPDARGHAREWLEHIVAAAAADDAAPYLSFAVPEELAAHLQTIVPDRASERIHAVALTRGQHAACMHRSLVVSGIARWRAMRHWLRRCGATHGLFLGLDHAVLPLALGFGVGGRLVSGVLFRPSVHYRELTPYRPTRGERMRDLRKDVMYRMMLRNRAVDRVFSLDPYFPHAAARRYRRADRIVALPDPVSGDATATPVWSGGLVDALPADRTVMLMFGELTERKGVLPLLEALEHVPDDAAERMAVVLAGRIDPALEQAVTDAADHVVRHRPGLWLHVENRRLDAAELAALVRRAGVILAPYQRFVGSSGVLLWAAGARRPVIAQDYGLVGRLVRDNALGVTVDTTRPRALAAALEWAAHRHRDDLCDRARMAAFADGRSPELFARMLLGLPDAGPGTGGTEPQAKQLHPDISD